MAVQRSGYAGVDERKTATRECAGSGPFGAAHLAAGKTGGRCGGEVVRLVDAWPAVVAAVIGAGVSGMRMRHGFAVAGTTAGGAFRMRDGRLVVTGRFGTIESAVETWSGAHLHIGAEQADSVLVIEDAHHWPVVEFVFHPRQLERFAASLPELEHPDQLSAPAHPRSRPHPEVRHHSHNEAWIERQWKRTGDYAAIEGIVRRTRLGRRRLFELLGRRWALPLAVDSLEEIVDAGFAEAGPQRVTFVTATGRFDAALGDLESLVCGRTAVVVGDTSRVAADPRRIEAVYAVRKPTRHGVTTAIEAFGPDGDDQLRLRLANSATNDQKMRWRSCLPFGRLCTG